MKKNKTRNPEQKKSAKNSRHFFNRINPLLYFLLCFLLPSQLGRHFFLPFSYLFGIRIDYLAPTLYATDILAVALICFNIKTVLRFLRSKTVIAFLLLVGINGIFALSKPLFAYRFLKLVELIMVFAVFKNGYAKYRSAIVAGLAFSVFFQAPLIISQLVSKHSLQGLWYFFGERYMSLSTPGIAKASLNGTELLRPYGTFSHPNSMAGFFLLIYVFFLTGREVANRWLKYAVLGLCSMFILFSFSKNAILVYLFLTFWHTVRERGKCRLCSFAAIFSPLLLASVFLMAGTDPESFEKRIILFWESLQIIAKYPITGTGLGSYLLASSGFPLKYPYFFLQPVHNMFLLLAAETGLVVFIGTAVLFIRRYARRMKDLRVLLVLLAVAFTGLSDHYWVTLQQNWLLMGAIFGIII